METNLEIGRTESEVEGRSPSLFRYSESIDEEPAKVRIFVLDAQPLLRQGISTYLNSQPDMMVCGEAGSVADARRTIAECQPQFVVTALRLGAGDSLKLIKELKTQNPGLSVLVYSAFEENIFAERAIRAGASGYVMKQAPSEKLATAVREIKKGGIYVSRELALSAFRKSLQRHRKDNHTLRSGNGLEELGNRGALVVSIAVRTTHTLKSYMPLSPRGRRRQSISAFSILLRSGPGDRALRSSLDKSHDRAQAIGRRAVAREQQ